MDEHPVAVAIAGYLTVLLQVAFPFVLFGRLKYPVLIMLVSLHLGIAVLLGLPIFSGVMIVADAVFLPDRFYRSYPGRIRTRSDSARAGRLSQAARRTREPATGTVTASAAFPDDAWHVTGREGMTAEPRRRARTLCQPRGGRLHLGRLLVALRCRAAYGDARPSHDGRSSLATIVVAILSIEVR